MISVCTVLRFIIIECDIIYNETCQCVKCQRHQAVAQQVQLWHSVINSVFVRFNALCND